MKSCFGYQNIEKGPTPKVRDLKLDPVRISGPYNQDICFELGTTPLKRYAAEREKIINSVLLICKTCKNIGKFLVVKRGLGRLNRDMGTGLENEKSQKRYENPDVGDLFSNI